MTDVELTTQATANPFLKRIWKIVSLLGAASGVLSVALLLTKAFAVGLSTPFQIMLDWYSAAANWLLSPLEPIAPRFVIYRDAVLSPDWKQIVVLYGLLCGAVLRTPGIVLKAILLSVILVLLLLILPVWPDLVLDMQVDPTINQVRLLISLGVFLVVVLAMAIAVVTGYLLRTLFHPKLALRPDRSIRRVLLPFGRVISSILVVLVGAVVFIALSAGLKLIGL